jgi:predicted ATP-dependent endonuclease of OLD family
VTQLAAHLRTRSLVLIDEPETHLHPPLVAALLRAIQALL